MNILQSITLDKFSEQPLYIQLSKEIEQSILDGFVKDGEFLPSEKILCEAFDISLKVVISAIQLLSDKGLVKRLVGKGTKVSIRPEINVNMNHVLGIESLYKITVKNVLKTHIMNDGKTPLISPHLSLLHQVGFLHDHSVFFRKVYFDQAIYKEDADFSNIIVYSKDTLHLKDLSLHSKMMVVNLPALEAAYLDVSAESAGFYLRTLLSQNQQAIAFMETYLSGEYTVWSDDPEIIQF
jgi:DNA-binding GntR family transcriptional regulator